MKYMLLIYNDDETRARFMGPDGKELMIEMGEFVRELTESGELVYTEGLSDPSRTKTVRVQNGAPVVTDGPLAEAKEYFGGYMLLDCETADRAVEIASRFPGLEVTPLEVRPLMGASGSEM